MSSEVLKEFLVAIKYDVDEASIRKFTQGVESAAARLSVFAAGIVGTFALVTKAVESSAESFEKLFYASQRTGASAANLKALAFIASQFGSSADEASAAVENLSKRLRDTGGENGGLAKQMRNIGVNMSGDNVQRLESFMDRVAKMPVAQRNAWLEAYGFTEKLFYALENPAARKAFDDYLKRTRQAGLDADGAAKGSTRFMQSLRDLRSIIDNLWDSAAASLFEKYGDVLKRFGDYLIDHQAQIKDAIVKIAGAVVNLAEEVGKILPSIDSFVSKIGGWNVAVNLLAGALLLKLIPGLSRVSALLLELTAVRMPIWLLGLLGVSGGAAAAVGVGVAAGVGGYIAGGDDPADAGDGSLWGKIRGVGRRIGRGVKNVLGLGGDKTSDASTDGGGSGASHGDVEAYIRRAAIARGIDPDVAVRVANSEGLRGYTTTGRDPGGDSGTSFGPFQLHYKNNIPGLSNPGLGDAFTKATGLNARDRSTWRQQVDFALDEAAKGSWGPWHGAANTGIGARQGLAGARPIGVNMTNPTAVANNGALPPGVPKAGTGYRAIPGLENWGIGGAQAAEGKNPFGGLDVGGLRDKFKTGGLGVSAASNAWHNTTNNSYSPSQNVTIHVDGAASPTDTAQAIGGNLRKSGSDLVRNMSPEAQ